MSRRRHTLKTYEQHQRPKNRHGLPMSKKVYRSEDDLLVFISSRMSDDMEPARKIAVEAIEQIEIGRPWAFGFTPASAETAEDTYLRKVRESDFVVWLVGAETTQPVVDEVNEAISSDRKLLVFKLPAEQRDFQTTGLASPGWELCQMERGRQY